MKYNVNKVIPHKIQSDSISFCIFCKGRLKYALVCIKNLIEYISDKDEIIFVDYSCPDNSGDVISSMQNEHINVIRVLNCDSWHINHARNCAGVNSSKDIIVMLDCDIILNQNNVDEIRRLEQGYYLRSKLRGKGYDGFVAVFRSDYMAVCGYEEGICCYGHDDKAFYHSLDRLGLKCVRMNSTFNPMNNTMGEKIRFAPKSSLNNAIYRLLRKRHKYRNNVGRNWGRV
ncbi:MAG: glycosyltransferase [Candidatus Lokiarchaeota archaeon]|nr:glycosyltransferase [Candidatus Lokiarchaeota archaeon]